MRRWRMSSMTVLPLVLLGLAAAILSCAPAETGPRAWIDWPRDGFEADVGATVTVIAHGYAREGVGEIQLAVDGQPYRLVSPEPAGEQLARVSLDWLPDAPGTYLLSVIVFGVDGQVSSTASVSVKVDGEITEPALTPGATETPLIAAETPEEPAATAGPSETPRQPTASPPPPATPRPATATPPPPTATTPPPPPSIVSLEANPRSIGVGECCTVRWAVEGVISAVYFEGEGVGDHDSSRECPATTTTYTLRAEGPGGEDTATVRVNVTEPPTPTPDTQGPAAPGGLSPTGGAAQGCGAVTLSWNAVSDPSGISTYYVKVEKTSGSPKPGGWTTTETELTIPAAWLECGHKYRWAVRAEDGAGNVGPWSAWAQFSVNIN